METCEFMLDELAASGTNDKNYWVWFVAIKIMWGGSAREVASNNRSANEINQSSLPAGNFTKNKYKLH